MRCNQSFMNLEQWCEIDERIYVADSDERYKQYAGLRHSESTIKNLAEMKNQNARLFLETFNAPRELYLTALENDSPPLHHCPVWISRVIKYLRRLDRLA